MSHAIAKKKVVKKPKAMEPPASSVPAPCERAIDFSHALDRVRKAANAGNVTAQRAIRQCLRNSPDLCAQVGNVAMHAEAALIDQITGGEVLTAEAIP